MTSSCYVLFVGVLVVCFAGLGAGQAGFHEHPYLIQVDPETRLFIDSFGRIKQFHGVNAVFKIFPWMPITEYFDSNNSICAEDIENLKEWGFNVIRLGVMWPGVEPERGQFNYTYIERISALIRAMGEAGIYTIVDFHQDVLSRKFCGEGIPDWAVSFGKENVKPFPQPVKSAYPTNEKGYPSIEDCLDTAFLEYYFTDSVASLFQSLYSNYNGLQDDFISYWKTMVRNFKDIDSVLGYELINEPAWGDFYSRKSLLEPGEADYWNLQPMYKTLNREIRKIDDDRIIFFERAVTDLFLPSGFTEGPGGHLYNNRQVQSYHVYCAPVNSEGDPISEVECDLADTRLFDVAYKDFERLGCGGMLTEFGAMTNESKGIDNIEFIVGMAEAKFQSWAYWQFKFFEDLTTQGTGESFYNADGTLQDNKVKALSRTYAKSIAGTPTFNSFQNNGNWEFKFIPNPTIYLVPTEIYYNEKYYYPNGISWTVSNPAAFSFNETQHNTLLLFNNPDYHGGEVTISLVPV